MNAKESTYSTQNKWLEKTLPSSEEHFHMHIYISEQDYKMYVVAAIKNTAVPYWCTSYSVKDLHSKTA